MPTFFQLRSFLSYWLDAVDEHSLHSPFFYDFYRNVIKAESNDERFKRIEDERKKFLRNHDVLQIDDFGSGPTKKSSGSSRTIAAIAKGSLSPLRFSRLYYRIIQYYNHKNVIELGTSLGINTLYLASHRGTHVTTFEGSKSLCDISRNLFFGFTPSSIEVIEGNLDSTLPNNLGKIQKIDFALIDANHRFAPTVKYSEQLMGRTHPRSVIVMDDIHLTPEMEKAWNTVRLHPLVYGSMDLYRCGILFFDPSLNKQHAVLQC